MKALNENWTDLYGMLGVDAKIGAQELEQQIREFETKRKDVLPPDMVAQCRRILLDADCRARYNRLSAQHRTGSPLALDYRAFVSSIERDDRLRKMHAPAKPAPVEVVRAARTNAVSTSTKQLLMGVAVTCLSTYIQTGSVVPGL